MNVMHEIKRLTNADTLVHDLNDRLRRLAYVRELHHSDIRRQTRREFDRHYMTQVSSALLAETERHEVKYLQ